MRQIPKDVVCWAQVRLQQVGDRGAAAAAEQLLRRPRLRVPLRHDPGAQQVRPCHLLAHTEHFRACIAQQACLPQSSATASPCLASGAFGQCLRTFCQSSAGEAVSKGKGDFCAGTWASRTPQTTSRDCSPAWSTLASPPSPSTRTPMARTGHYDGMWVPLSCLP